MPDIIAPHRQEPICEVLNPGLCLLYIDDATGYWWQNDAGWHGPHVEEDDAFENIPTG